MENIMIAPPIITINGGISLINIHAHIGPRIASSSINIPTIAAGVFLEPMVIQMKPKPIWKVPSKNERKRSFGEI
jgi:hypothetical protein